MGRLYLTSLPQYNLLYTHLSHLDDGVEAIKSLKIQFGAQSTGDRAEAMARVQKSYIDHRAKISVADVTKQYNEMSLAVNDIASTGGARLDDTLLISMFENSLPTKYLLCIDSPNDQV